MSAMSGRRVSESSEAEISDDDQSFAEPVINENTTAIIISSDEEVTEITSDEDPDYFPSPKTVRNENKLQQRSNVIKKLFKTGVGNQNATHEPVPSTSYFSSEKKPDKNEGNVITGHVLPVGGVHINFPMKPYGCQVALMFKIIIGINKKQNCLLESPTGSGKTLALLCGALAWQHHEYNRLNELQEQQCLADHPELSSYVADSPPRSTGDSSPSKLFKKTRFGTKSIYDEGSSDSESKNFTFVTKRKETQHTDSSSDIDLVKIHKKRRVIYSSDSERSSGASPIEPSTPDKKSAWRSQEDEVETPKELRVPKIYYGARTHKQLQQVVKEFGRTVYCRDTKMSILSSRDYSCIKELDKSLYKTKNDMCKECVPKKSDTLSKCEYFNNKSSLSHSALPAAFDLEDLITAGHQLRACPYYAARTMAGSADIVFCPYNYLIDPFIRNSMSIDLRDEIVILDEAHNIEDICRDAATFTISRDHVLSALLELEQFTQYIHANQDIMADVLYIIRALTNWDDWFKNQTQFIIDLPLRNGEATHTLEVEFFAETLKNHNIGREQCRDFSKSAEIFCKKLREDASRLYGVSQATGTLVESIAFMLMYLFNNNCEYMEDFRPVLVRNIYEARDTLANSRGWRSTRDQIVTKETLSLRLLCMSPAVVFSDLRVARCVILSSGTLAPIISLYSELGANFPLKVSPNHVVPPDRVWVGTLNTCPDGMPLECTMRGTERPAVLDALGRAVHQVASVTPNGVLCFLPSYVLMNKLIKRWRETGLWRELSDIKELFQESRSAQDHNDVMEAYYESVCTKKGAILFAVYRGKVSEGMDFKDHQARAVITVGIPYPNTFDTVIREKMRYNDKHTRDRNLLPSSEWLRVQAYRALNQAVGRCVRHREDWGAVLLCDSRFTSNYYTEHLAHWLRNFLGDNHHSFNSLISSPKSLSSFMQKMTIKEEIDL